MSNIYDELDFSSLTKIPSEYVTEDLRHRFNSVWISVVAKRSGIITEKIPYDLMEAEGMLEETMARWKEEWLEEGISIGEARGEARGKAKGEVIGEARGEARGKLKGESTGLSYALNALLKKRFDTFSNEFAPQLASISDLEILKSLINSACSANSLDEFKKELQDILKK